MPDSSYWCRNKTLSERSLNSIWEKLLILLAFKASFSPTVGISRVVTVPDISSSCIKKPFFLLKVSIKIRKRLILGMNR